MDTTERLVVAVDKNLKRKVFSKAKSKGINVSYLVRNFFKDYIQDDEKGKKGNRTAKIAS